MTKRGKEGKKGSISFINSMKENLSAELEVKASSYSLVILCLNNMYWVDGVCNTGSGWGV